MARRPTISDDARAVVEVAYGRPLADAAWERIKASTNRFVSEDQLTPNLKELRQRLTSLSKAADYFEREFPNGLPAPTTLKKLHRSLLKELSILDLEVATVMPYLQTLARVSRILADYSLHNPECLDALSRDELWDIWIADLTGIAQRERLPSGARKDSDKTTGQASPFVRLVNALQRFIPPSRRRFIHSIDGLATGVSRARKNYKKMKEELLAGQEQLSD